MAHTLSIDGPVTRTRWNPDSLYFPAHVLLQQTLVTRVISVHRIDATRKDNKVIFMCKDNNAIPLFRRFFYFSDAGGSAHFINSPNH